MLITDSHLNAGFLFQRWKVSRKKNNENDFLDAFSIANINLVFNI